MLAGAVNAQDLSEDLDPLEGQVEVTEFLTVDLHVQDTDLAKVLQMLSIQSQKNIIVTKNVTGAVTAHLYDVTFYEALDSILNANGYGYVEEGNFIKVYTLEEIEQIEQAARQLVHERFEMSYLNASDAAIFVTPLLSEEGSIAINGEAPDGFDPDEGDGGRDTWAFAATLVVSDYPENVERIAALLDELDTRPKQVLVEATVLQTTLNEDNAWGVDWSLVGDIDFLDFTNPLSGVDDLISGEVQPDDNQAWNVRSNSGRTSGPGTLKVGVVSNDISVFMRVLDEVMDTTIMSRPRVLTLNRQRGEILIGRRIGYLSTTATETSTTQTVQFLDTGTQLIFRPFVGKDGFIRMELKPSISEGVIREVSGSDGGTFTVPDEITQELTTNVVVRDGHTIVLGGLFKEETTLSRRQVPVLGDIPLIGAAFRGHDDSTRRSEITFLITPTIMHDEVLVREGAAVSEAVEEIRIGSRKGVLPWSNDRLTSQHNMKAEEYLRNGDTEMALWHINQSLNLRKNQPLVIQMREEITGESVEWFNGQMFERMVDRIRDDEQVFVPVQDSQDNIGQVFVDPLAQEFEPAPQVSEIPPTERNVESDSRSFVNDIEPATQPDEDVEAVEYPFEPDSGLDQFETPETDGGDGEPENDPAAPFVLDSPSNDEPGLFPPSDQPLNFPGSKQFRTGDRTAGSAPKPSSSAPQFDADLQNESMTFKSDSAYLDVDGDPMTPGTLVGRWHQLQHLFQSESSVELVDVPTDDK